MAPVAGIVESLRSFVGALEAFLSSLAAVSWGPLALGLLLHAGYLTLRSRAWFNALRAAYPTERFRWRNVWAAYVAAFGINGVVPAKPGGILRLYLAKQSVPRSSYSAVGSSFLVETVFDLPVAMLVIVFAFTQGVFPALPDLSRLPVPDLAWAARDPQLAAFVITAMAVLALVAIAVASVRVQAFWAHVRQGLTILGDRPRYLRQVLAWQAAGWLMRLTGFWFLLEAFDIPASPRNVLLVMAVQGLATLVPFTPNGAGAQQALLAVVFAGAASGSEVAAYAVGQQLSIAAFGFMLALAALAFVFRTTDWRSIVRAGRRERAGEEAPERV